MPGLRAAGRMGSEFTRNHGSCRLRIDRIQIAIMRIVVVGCGSIGQRHIGNLQSLGQSELTVYDPAMERAREFASPRRVAAAESLDVALANSPDAVFVCTPPHLHTEMARRAVETGAHIFMEKPIASSLDGVDELLAEARLRGSHVYVGYNLRFHAGLVKAKELLDSGTIGRLLMIRAETGQYLPDWRPTQDYRSGYITRQATGGGIILDASHEIDYVRWLGGEIERVYCAADHLSGLEMDTEDSASMVLRMAGSVVGEVHLDCVQRGYARNCKMIGDEGTLIWDFKEGVRLLRAGKQQWRTFPIVPDTNEMYIAETKHFLQCVRGEAAPLVDGETGRRVLAVALAAKRSAELGAEVSVA